MVQFFKMATNRRAKRKDVKSPSNKRMQSDQNGGVAGILTGDARRYKALSIK